MSILSICFLIGLIYYKYLKYPERIFLGYIIITFFVEWIGYYTLYLSPEKKVSRLLYNIYLPTQFVLISLYFYQFIKNDRIKKLLILLTISFLCLFLSFILVGYSFFKTLMFSNFILSIYSIAYFRLLLKTEEDVLLNPNFWIVTGILFFNAGCFFLSSFIIYISQQNLELAQKLYTINHLLNIIYYSLVTYGFICQRRLARS